MRCHFDLGARAVAESVVVRWPDGTTTVLADVKADQILDVRQPR
jgi:hypothetical protein